MKDHTVHASSRHRGDRRALRRKAALFALPLACWSGVASAQNLGIGEGVILEPVLPYDYDQDRNVSLRQQLQRDYGALGLRTGAFLIFPQIEAGVGASDNVTLAPQGEQEDLLFRFAPSLDLRSDWARHRIDLSASSVINRYADQTLLDRNTWDIGAQGRLDVGDYADISAEGRVSQLQEEPFSSGLEAEQAILSRYRRDFAALRGSRQVGRTRLSATAAYTHFAFQDVDLGDGTFGSQANRDREQFTLAAQGEYALSPGAVTYVQLSHTTTEFRLPGTPADPARDSRTWRLLGGFNADLPGVLRGTIAAGYMRRDFDSELHDPIDGFSAEAEVTYFYDASTNFVLSARRVLQEAPTGSSDAFFDTSVRLTAERTVRRNVLLSVGGYVGTIDEVQSPVSYDVQQVNASAEYFAPRWFGIRLSAAYSRRDGKGTTLPSDVHEMSALLTLVFHP